MSFSKVKDYIPPKFVEVKEGDTLEEVWNYYVERHFDRNKKIDIVKFGKNRQKIEIATDSGSSWKIYENKLKMLNLFQLFVKNTVIIKKWIEKTRNEMK